MIALTHLPSPHIDACQRTFVDHFPVDYDAACSQHADYRRLLGELGADVRTSTANLNYPDCVFIEDVAVALDELLVVASMGSNSRALEPLGVLDELQTLREVERVEQPATIEGGDVLKVGRDLLVGRSARTNQLGVDALSRIARRRGYRVTSIDVLDCLHLKTACTALPDGRLLVNPTWLNPADLGDFECIMTLEPEPWGANTLSIDGLVVLAREHEATAELIEKCGFEIRRVDISEFAKAEGGVTCLSLLIR
ncbi:MAG: hypothetical protein QGG36_24865 [Pirellulaceae bacterium]|jgi:dimethylargininase|nr:hypothetical protein [Pirellulaceae bacterium]MDP7019052.1 hypothetical protein [Pirellulaceae bacterium]